MTPPEQLQLAGRPALKIIGNDFTLPRTDFWSSRLEPHRDNIKRAITSVGRIEFRNHPSFEYAGTGWLVTEDIVITNRHVAETFAFQQGGKFVFDKNHAEGRKIKVNIDFREEFQVDEEEEFEIVDVLYIEPRSGSDIAFLKVKRNGDIQRSVIPLANRIPPSKTEIVVIGYPARDSQRNPVEPSILLQIFEDIYDVKRLQPGEILSLNALNSEVPIFTHDCSTLGGNSGSIVFDYQTGEAIGLHFAGIFRQENHAVPATIVAQRLNDLLSGTLRVESSGESPVIVFASPTGMETVDNDTPVELEDTPCLSPEDEETSEDSILEGVPFPAVNTQLPISGTGYYSYSQHRHKQFGLSETIKAIQEIGKLWFTSHSSGPVFGVGNISLNGGGKMEPHQSHRTGLDVDIRLLRKDGARIGVTFKDPNYSLTRTQQLVNTILKNPILKVNLILCNDPRLKGVTPSPGHDDHLHVRFSK
jgi:endonuclease G